MIVGKRAGTSSLLSCCCRLYEFFDQSPESPAAERPGDPLDHGFVDIADDEDRSDLGAVGCQHKFPPLAQTFTALQCQPASAIESW